MKLTMKKSLSFNLYDIYLGDCFIARLPKEDAIAFIWKNQTLVEWL